MVLDFSFFTSTFYLEKKKKVTYRRVENESQGIAIHLHVLPHLGYHPLFLSTQIHIQTLVLIGQKSNNSVQSWWRVGRRISGIFRGLQTSLDPGIEENTSPNTSFSSPLSLKEGSDSLEKFVFPLFSQSGFRKVLYGFSKLRRGIFLLIHWSADAMSWESGLC